MHIGILVTCMAIGLLIWILTSFDGLFDGGGITNDVVIFASAILTILCIILFCIFETKSKIIYEKEPSSIEHLVSLQDNNGIQGRFYCRHGYIESAMYYQYMVQLSDGAMTMNKIKSDGVNVYYDDDPRVEWFYGKKTWWIFYDDGYKKQKLYVPKGTISDDMNIDLK